MQGERVGGKDHHIQIMVEPNCIELNASDLTGGGLEQCQAGEQAEVLLTPRDALGNPNASFSMGGGTEGQLSVRVMVEDSDAEQTTAIMTPDVAKSGRLKVSSFWSFYPVLNCALQFCCIVVVLCFCLCVSVILIRFGAASSGCFGILESTVSLQTL